jgi:hypothetical protein
VIESLPQVLGGVGVIAHFLGLFLLDQFRIHPGGFPRLCGMLALLELIVIELSALFPMEIK